MNWIKQLFQDEDGDSDEMALLTVCGFFTFLGLEIYSVVFVPGFKFDPNSFGIGMGAALGAASAGMGWKSNQEGKRNAS
jgi:hypothetical protein